MRRYVLLISLVAFTLFGRFAPAQVAQSLRIEIPSNPNEAESFNVTPLAERGVLMTVRTGGFYDNTPILLSFRRLDTNLKPLWTREFKQDVRYKQLLTYHNEQHAYHLFREYDTNRYRFLKLSLDDGSAEAYDGTLVDQFDVKYFKVMGSQAYVGGYRHGRPVVMTYSFFDNTTRVLPGLYANHIELTGLELDEARHEVNVLVHSSRRRCQFSVRTYNYDSRPVRTIDFGSAKHSLISGKLLPINEQESLLVGNYSTDCTPFSQGIYVTRIRHDDPDASAQAVGNLQYIEFSQLQNFFNYLKPHRQQKLLAKAQKKKEEGRDYKFRYRLLVHDLKPSRDGLTLIAEVYYPQYKGNTLAYGGYLRSVDRYEGYRYTHAFVCGFDRQGKLLWDNCLPIKELLSQELIEMVQLSQQGDRMVLAYPNGNEITTEVIQGSKVLKETERFKLLTNAENERVTFSAQDNLMAWYDRYFLACGFQKISPTGTYGTQREVFYLNKFSYDPDAQPTRSATATTGKTSGGQR